ncbi:MAG TPA: SDR family oxidoreductase [Solirubrobacteraceae bacterium]|nr:SDR family oxidoreductase [Solirubrobacteraceae bacterium]
MSLPVPSKESVVVVTGASSGIGAELTRQLAALGHDLVVVARREDRLQELADDVRVGHGVDVIVHAADLQLREARLALLGAVADQGRHIVGLANNAGYGSSGRAWELDLDHEEGEIQLNVAALHHLTLAVVPEMVRRRAGAVLNVASAAAFQPMPGMATYAATKAFVQSFSEALHAELAGSGVSVTTLCPGPVDTEFGAVAGIDEGVFPGVLKVSAEEVAAQAVRGMLTGKRSVVPGPQTKVLSLAGRYAPRTVLLPAMRRQTLS